MRWRVCQNAEHADLALDDPKRVMPLVMQRANNKAYHKQRCALPEHRERDNAKHRANCAALQSEEKQELFAKKDASNANKHGSRQCPIHPISRQSVRHSVLVGQLGSVATAIGV